MDIKLFDGKTGAATGSVVANDTLFGADFNEALVHQVVVAFMARSRSGTKAQKHVLKLLVVRLSLLIKKVQVVLVQVHLLAQFGLVVVVRLLLLHVTLIRK